MMLRQLCLGLLLAISVSPLYAQSLQPPSGPYLITSGHGEISTEPDMATLSFAVSLRESSTVKAREGVDTRVAKLVGELEKIGIKQQDMEASNLRIFPDYQYGTNQPPKLLGYWGRRQVKVRLYQLERLGQIIDTALKAGLNTVENIQYGVKEEGRYQLQARELAIADSKLKAAELAKSYEAKLGSIFAVGYASNQPESIPMFKAMSAAPGEAPSYLPEPVRFQDSVEVIFNLE